MHLKLGKTYLLRGFNFMLVSLLLCFILGLVSEAWTATFKTVNGEVVMESENYTRLGGYIGGEWFKNTTESNYKGSGYMQSTTTDPLYRFNSNLMRVEYDIDFNETGTYYLHLRSWAYDHGQNGFFATLNGQQFIYGQPSGTWIIVGARSDWFWKTIGGPDWEAAEPVKINVTSKGVKKLAIYRRDLGSKLDRIWLTKHQSNPQNVATLNLPNPSIFIAGNQEPNASDEIIGTWSSGIWYWNPANSSWKKMNSNIPLGGIAAGDFSGDGKADVASGWDTGLWYQNGATLAWKKVTSEAPDNLAAGDVTGDGRAEIIGTWSTGSTGIWYWNPANSSWHKMNSDIPLGGIAAGDFSGDGKADVASGWDTGLWYQNGATLAWKKVTSEAPDNLAAGDVSGDGRAEIIGTWSSGIWYWNPANSSWKKMSSSIPLGGIAAGDFSGDGKADVASGWDSGLWYQNGVTLGWKNVTSAIPDSLAAGNIIGE